MFNMILQYKYIRNNFVDIVLWIALTFASVDLAAMLNVF
jgi:hypothetical protein